MRDLVHEMHKIYSIFSTISPFEQNDAHILLPSGKAISPGAAAHCLLEMVRTTKFIRGIHKAINDKLVEKKQINILYAGCGPYATLVTPLLTLFPENQIKVDILDINEISLSSAKQVLKGLELNNFVDEYFLADATTFKVNKDYDLVISETLQTALRNEPFVAIYQNLAPQINNKCEFIPQEVVVDLKLNTSGKWDGINATFTNRHYIKYGEVLNINKQTAIKDLPIRQVRVQNPYDYENVEVKYYTTVKVYKDEILSEGDCSLNLPIKVDEIHAKKHKDYHFSYKHEFPNEISVKILNSNS